MAARRKDRTGAACNGALGTARLAHLLQLAVLPRGMSQRPVPYVPPLARTAFRAGRNPNPNGCGPAAGSAGDYWWWRRALAAVRAPGSAFGGFKIQSALWARSVSLARAATGDGPLSSDAPTPWQHPDQSGSLIRAIAGKHGCEPDDDEPRRDGHLVSCKVEPSFLAATLGSFRFGGARAPLTDLALCTCQCEMCLTPRTMYSVICRDFFLTITPERWCLYCLCEGVGLASIGSPVCKADQKLCCIKSQGQGDLGPLMGDEGLCLSNQKCFCCSQAVQCIPTKPFIEICGKRVFGPEKPGGGGFPEIKMSGNGFGNAHETLESCQRDLAQAVANEDFLRKLKRK